MKKNVRYLIIVLVCIVVLAGVILTLALTGQEDSTVSSNTGSVSSETVNALINREDSELKTMQVDNEEGGYTIHAEEKVVENSEDEDSSTASATKEMVYTVDGLKEDYLNNSTVLAAINDAKSLIPSRDLGEIDNLDEYGLEKPSAKVKVTYTDGTTFSYWVGDESAGTSGARYICEEGSNNVYIVTLTNYLYGSNVQFVRNDILNITSKDESASSEENLEVSIKFSKITLTGTNYEEPIELVSEDGGTTMKMVKPKKTGTNDETMETLKQSLTSLTAYGAVVVEPTQEDLDKYGLSDPAAKVEFVAEDDPYTMICSNADDEGFCYMMLEGRNVIYKVEESGVSAWLHADAFEIQSRLTFQPVLSTLETMTVEANNEKNTFTFTRTKNEEESTEDEIEYDYSVAGPDGKELDYENFRNFYKSFIVVSLLEDTPELPEEDPYISVTYTYFDNDNVDVVDFYKVSERRYTVVLNGEVLGNIVTNGMEVALENMDLLIKGEEVPDTVG